MGPYGVAAVGFAAAGEARLAIACSGRWPALPSAYSPSRRWRGRPHEPLHLLWRARAPDHLIQRYPGESVDPPDSVRGVIPVKQW